MRQSFPAARFHATPLVLAEVEDERAKQDAKWGEQNHPDGTSAEFIERALIAKKRNDILAQEDGLAWRDILYEEVCEAFAEEDPERLRAELVQVAAVAVAWVEAIDRRGHR